MTHHTKGTHFSHNTHTCHTTHTPVTHLTPYTHLSHTPLEHQTKDKTQLSHTSESHMSHQIHTTFTHLSHTKQKTHTSNTHLSHAPLIHTPHQTLPCTSLPSSSHDIFCCMFPATASPGSDCRYDEYKCVDGAQCIPSSYHCDGETDCLDRSDEIGCGKSKSCGLTPIFKRYRI